MDLISDIKCFGGRQKRYKHHSIFTKCDMHFSIFLPSEAEISRVPVLYWLPGQACTDEDFIQKSGAQRFAAQHGIAIVATDTSPRGSNVPDAPTDDRNLGLGAGFYLTATQAPWSMHYHMYEYVFNELPALIRSNFRIDMVRQSIFGHAMGGHGAMTIALKNPKSYCSVSAFAPICSPIDSTWGQKALKNYLGDNMAEWEKYDTCKLIEKASDKKFELLIDQGLADGYLLEQLKPGLLKEVCTKNGYPLRLRFQGGYDHSYHFISTFIGEHIAFHANHLKGLV